MTQEQLKQVRVLDPPSQVDRVADVLIDDGKIVDITEPGISAVSGLSLIHI